MPLSENEKLKHFLNACADAIIAESQVKMTKREAILHACQEQYRYLKIARSDEEKEDIAAQLKLLEKAKDELIEAEMEETSQEEAAQKKKEEEEKEKKKKEEEEDVADTSRAARDAPSGIDDGGHYALADQENISNPQELLNSDRNIIVRMNTFNMGVSAGDARDLPPPSVRSDESTFQIQPGVNATVISQGVHREMRLEISGKLSPQEKQEALEKAQQIMQERGTTGDYHLTDNNCVRTVKEALHKFAPNNFSKEADMFGMHLPGLAGKLDSQVSAVVNQQMQANRPAVADGGSPINAFGMPVPRPSPTKTAELT